MKTLESGQHLPKQYQSVLEAAWVLRKCHWLSKFSVKRQKFNFRQTGCVNAGKILVHQEKLFNKFGRLSAHPGGELVDEFESETF